MTKVVFYRSNGNFYGFEEDGHAGYGEEGTDIVCSAISAMTMMIVNAVQDSYESDVYCDVDEETTRIVVSSKAALPEFEEDGRKVFAVQGLFLAYYRQLTAMVEDYPDYLTVEISDQDFR